MLQNMSRESFENLRDSFQRGSIVEEGRLLGLLGSIVSQNQSIVEQDFRQSLKRFGDENSIEEDYAEMQDDNDEFPQVDVYIDPHAAGVNQLEPAEQQLKAVQVDQPLLTADDDARSLETVDIIPRSADVSPVKVWK